MKQLMRDKEERNYETYRNGCFKARRVRRDKEKRTGT